MKAVVVNPYTDKETLRRVEVDPNRKPIEITEERFNKLNGNNRYRKVYVEKYEEDIKETKPTTKVTKKGKSK